MNIIRINEFHAAAGQSDAALASLRQIVPAIEASPGCQSCELLQGLGYTADEVAALQATGAIA